MGFDREQHCVLRARVRRMLHGARVGRMGLRAVFQDQPKAVSIDGLQIAIARNKGDVLACHGEFRTKVSADCTGTDYRNFQTVPPVSRFIALSVVK
jgi:hypothetical protein